MAAPAKKPFEAALPLSLHGSLVMNVLLLASLVSACAERASPDPAVITKLLRDGHIPSATLAVVTGNGSTLAYTSAFGHPDPLGNLSATTGTPYMLASISKTVAAWAVMQAVEQGALALEKSTQ